MAIHIGEKQLKILEPYVFENYVTELVEHWNSEYPHLKQKMGPKKLREILREGALKAKDDGFDQRGPTRFYVEMMVLFGSGFMTDPQYPWILESLAQDAELLQLQRADRLFYKVDNYLKNIAGENKKHEMEAKAYLGRFDASQTRISSTGMEEQLFDLLKNIHSGRAEHDDENGLKALIDNSLKKAQDQYDYTEPMPQALFVLLAYLYGHEFDEDPFLSFELPKGSPQSAATQQLENLIRQWANTKFNDNTMNETPKET